MVEQMHSMQADTHQLIATMLMVCPLRMATIHTHVWNMLWEQSRPDICDMTVLVTQSLSSSFIHWHIFISCWAIVSTQPQLNILSGGLTECLVKPRHVGVSTLLQTSALLPVPEEIVVEKHLVGIAGYLSRLTSHCQLKELDKDC